LAEARRDEGRALQAVEKAERIARRLHERAEQAKPRHVQEANGVLEDARMLAKIANDQVLIAENHVRRVIHEEYPPVKQERLRKKYLPEQAADKKPFSF
jgi:DNA-binding phage protein